MSPTKVIVIIDPFLSKTGANVITFPDKNLLIVTDHASNLKRISELIAAIEQAGPDRIIKFYHVEHIVADQVAQQLTQALATRLSGRPEGIVPARVSSDKRTNQRTIVGTEENMEGVFRLAKAFDVTLDQRIEVYSFQHINAEPIDRLVKGMFDPAVIDRLYRSPIDHDDDLLVVTATDEFHNRIEINSFSNATCWISRVQRRTFRRKPLTSIIQIA